MNFWEARQAALSGKKVKIVGEECIYTALNFADWAEGVDDYGKMAWNNDSISAVWELVEKPEYQTVYIDLRDCGFLYTRHFSSGSIEITVDEKGKLISAKNV